MNKTESKICESKRLQDGLKRFQVQIKASVISWVKENATIGGIMFILNCIRYSKVSYLVSVGRCWVILPLGLFVTGAWFVYFVFVWSVCLLFFSFICYLRVKACVVGRYMNISRSFYLKIFPNPNFHTKIIIFPFMKCCRPESTSIRYLVVKFLIPRFQCNQR